MPDYDYDRETEDLRALRAHAERRVAQLRRLTLLFAVFSLALGVALTFYGAWPPRDWASVAVLLAGAINTGVGAHHLWQWAKGGQ